MRVVNDGIGDFDDVAVHVGFRAKFFGRVDDGTVHDIRRKPADAITQGAGEEHVAREFVEVFGASLFGVGETEGAGTLLRSVHASAYRVARRTLASRFSGNRLARRGAGGGSQSPQSSPALC